MTIIKHDDQTITFSFFYSGRGYAWKLIKEGFRLLFKGRADLAMHLTAPRDIYMFDAAEQAGLFYDDWVKCHGQFACIGEAENQAEYVDPFASERTPNPGIQIAPGVTINVHNAAEKPGADGEGFKGGE